MCGSIGICLGYHRLLTHRSLRVPKWLERTLVTIGALALQGGPILWVSAHRRHHAHTEDLERDPHSSARGFWWSHMFWMFYQRPEIFDYVLYKRHARDVDRDPYYRLLDRNVSSIILQVLLGLMLLGLGGWSFVIYGVFLRTVVLWHSTWLINSATHMVGYRNFDDDNDARNVWWAALLTYGEGWHNNHHANPNVAKAGLRWWEIDMTWWAIQVLGSLGLTEKVVKLTSPRTTP
ncbi:fatty-acid desaturase [Rubidibacter lacunae KORDI 51-2]|uniref:Fatty-acid desaturase n=1 Tax=Rubidibacter lacunae KORDI 51-2 TaxID=582515 RepID=U5DP85_9CHRO|nr:fatty-acid desaturase [Rubidibacter lacunae KORDI 51-2]